MPFKFSYKINFLLLKKIDEFGTNNASTLQFLGDYNEFIKQN